MKIHLFFFLLLFLIPASGETQQLFPAKSNQHRFYFYWGWNRAFFSKSDIYFKGPEYDFTLKNVIANDRQSEFTIRNYFHPSKITIPQTNYGIGYYFQNHYILSLGVDHMKYVVEKESEAGITGWIGESYHYGGLYNDNQILLYDNVLKMEHTDGLNYLVAEISRSDNLLQSFPAMDGKLELNLIEGIGGGVLIPKTDITLLGKERNNQYHLSGYGLSAKAGLHLTFFKHFFLRAELKAGYIDLTSINVTSDGSGKGSQSFFFLQPSGQFGGMFYLK